MNLLINLLIAWLLFPHSLPVTLWGLPGVALDLVPSTFLPVVLMTIAICAGLRRSAQLARWAWASAVAVRCSVFAALAVLALVPATLLVLTAFTELPRQPWSWRHFVAFKMVFSVVHAGVLTPPIVLALSSWAARVPRPAGREAG